MSLAEDSAILRSRVGVGQVVAGLVRDWRKVRTPEGRVLGNAQAERSDTGATESTPPMADVFTNVGSGKGEMAG